MMIGTKHLAARLVRSAAVVTALWGAVLSGGCSSAPDEVKVLSFNIRMSGQPAADGPNFWGYRREAVVRLIDAERPTVMGIQEGCPDQVAYLDEALEADYGRIGVGRDDGREAGEMMAVYYLRSAVELLDWGTFWLSQTPDTPSLGWDGACRRTATWAKFRLAASGREFLFVNTHLDHKGRAARREGLKLLAERIVALGGGEMPVFLTADFNSPADAPIFAPLKAVLHDARAESPASDDRPTFNGWGRAGGKSIDHIFFGGAEPVSFRTLDGDYGVPYVSDHYPVEGCFRLK